MIRLRHHRYPAAVAAASCAALLGLPAALAQAPAAPGGAVILRGTAPTEQCRDFTTPVVIDGQTVQARGQACLQPDGSWRVTRNAPPGEPQQTYTIPPAAPPAYAPPPAYAYGYGYPYPYPYPYPYGYAYPPWWYGGYGGSFFFFGHGFHHFHHHHFHHHHFHHGSFHHGGFQHGGFHR